jgi:hypothetical protein
LLPLVILTAIAAMPASTWIRNFARDDALYYPTVARNIALGLGSTYDGITPTNGYHPLWCWIQVPIAATAGSLDPMTYLWWVKMAMVVVVALAVMVWAHLIRELSGSNWAAATFSLLLGGYWWSVHTLNSGMETPLVVALMGISLLLAHRLLGNGSTSTAVALGCAMAATFLARLDSIFFLGVLGCLLLVRLRRDVRIEFAWLTPLLLIPLPYLWWNVTAFGSVIPVSGIRKSVSRPTVGDQVGIVARFVSEKLDNVSGVIHPTGVVVLALILVLGLGSIWIIRRECQELATRLGVLWVLPVGAIVHFLYVAVFMVEVNVAWYQYAEYLTVFLAASVVVAAAASWIRARDATRGFQWVPFSLALAATLAILGAFAPKAMPDVANVRSYDAAVWAREHLSDDHARFGMYDPGVFQYVSGLPTIALNGLASTREVVSLVQEGKWSEIIRRYNVDYVVQFVPSEDISAIPANYIEYRSETFDRFAWRYSGHKVGRLLILDASYPMIDSLI